MKLIFGVDTEIRLDDAWPVKVGDTIFEFTTSSDGTVESISTSFEENNISNWPKVVDGKPPVKLNINAGHIPRLPFIIDDLIVLQGMLSVYREIDIKLKEYRTEWIPESEAEKESLQLNGFSSRKTIPPAPVLPFDILARSALTCGEFRDIQVPLSFYRRGVMDIGNGQHISAFYNFFLFIECLFADGKHKTAAMLEKLASNDELCKAITTSSSEYLAIAAFKNSEIHKKLESNASPKDIIEYLIDRRGFLHHHSLKNKSIWHPERQGEWEPHARFSQFVAHKIAFDRIGKKFFTQSIEKEYLEMSTNS